MNLFCFAGAQKYMLRVSFFFLYDLLGTCFVVMRRVSFRSFRQYISPTHPSRYFWASPVPFWSFSSYGVTRPRGRVWIRFWSGNLLNEPEKERKEVKDGRSGGILTCEPYLHTYTYTGLVAAHHRTSLQLSQLGNCTYKLRTSCGVFIFFSFPASWIIEISPRDIIAFRSWGDFGVLIFSLSSDNQYRVPLKISQLVSGQSVSRSVGQSISQPVSRSVDTINLSTSQVAGPARRSVKPKENKRIKVRQGTRYVLSSSNYQINYFALSQASNPHSPCPVKILAQK